jgi:hypothetical protein
MLKRLLFASIIFFVALGLLMLPSLTAIYRAISEQRATGFAFVVGSTGENIFRLGVLILSTLFAYWLSAKLIRH